MIFKPIIILIVLGCVWVGMQIQPNKTDKPSPTPIATVSPTPIPTGLEIE